MLFIKMCIIFSVYFTCKCKLIAYENSETHHSVNRCLSFIFKNVFRNSNFDVFTNYMHERNFEIPIFIFNGVNYYKFESAKPKIEVFVLDLTYIGIEKTISRLQSNHLLHSRALFILITNTQVKLNVALLFNLFIHNVLVVTNEGRVFTYHPYKYENINNPDLDASDYGYCNKLVNFVKPIFWRNSTVKSLLKTAFPYVTGNNTGMEEHLIELFRERLQFRGVTKYVGGRIFAPPYSSAKKLLKTREVDIFGGYITTFPMDVWYSDITPSYFYDSMHFICPIPLDKTTFHRLVNIFPLEFWILFVSTLATSCLMTKIMFKIPLQEKLLILIKILMENEIDVVKSGANSKRILLFSWILFVTITSTIFRNYLIIIMETSVKNSPLETLEDIIESKLPIETFLNIKPYYNNVTNSKLDINTVGFCKSFDACHGYVAKYQNSVSVGGYGVMNYNIIPKNYIKNNEPILHISKEVIYSFHFHLLFTKGHPLFEQCGNIILRSMANGWFAKEFADMKYLLQLKTHGKRKIKSKIIAWAEMRYVFIAWLIGLILSIVIFIIELIVNCVAANSNKLII